MLKHNKLLKHKLQYIHIYIYIYNIQKGTIYDKIKNTNEGCREKNGRIEL